MTELNSSQHDAQAEFRAFAAERIAPYADSWDRDERTPPELIRELAGRGYLGALVPEDRGGAGMDMLTFGVLNEELGRACSSVRSLLTVHSMVEQALLKWGRPAQRERWLPRLAAGETIGAFALSEPNAGSDANAIATTARRDQAGYTLSGHKRWTTYGQIADLFLVFARYEGKPAAFLLERDTPGLTVEPIGGMLGTRASMLAALRMDECRIPADSMVGGPGFGIAAVATTALDIGRYSVACGSVGIAQACLDASLSYTAGRKQFDTLLKDFQLIRRMISEMIANVKAARLLCYQAGILKDRGDSRTVMETWIAKYFASTVATKAAADAVQIHGANGCSPDFPVQRYFRDAKIMEIIEGSTQLQQITIAEYGYQEQRN